MMINLSNIVSNTNTKKVFLGYGDEAIRNTLIAMISIIKSSSRDYYVRRWAEHIVSGTPRDEYSRVEAIFNFLADNIDYLKDMGTIEMLKKPQLVLRELEKNLVPLLDCDCMSMLISSLLLSIGVPVAIRAIAPQNRPKYSHVYAIAKVKDFGWIPLDLTKPDLGMGWKYPSPSKTMTMRVK